MRRGDIITASPPAEFGKPRPVVVVQSDRLADADTVLVCLLTSVVRNAPMMRLTVEANAETGLRERSQIQVEKVFELRPNRCGTTIGRIDRETVARLDGLLAACLGLADGPSMA